MPGVATRQRCARAGAMVAGSQTRRLCDLGHGGAAGVSLADACATCPDYRPVAFARGRRRVALPVLRPPCRWEGEVLEACTTCGGSAAEGRHVRECLSDATEAGRCTRGRNAGKDPDIASCLTCPGYAPPLPSPRPGPLPDAGG